MAAGSISINQSIKFIISVAHCRLDFTINSSIAYKFKITSAMNSITAFVRTLKRLSSSRRLSGLRRDDTADETETATESRVNSRRN